MTEYVLGFIFDQTNDRVILQVKDKPDWQYGRRNGIGGHVELHETYQQAMAREGIEETGQLFEWNKKFILTVGRDVNIHVFKVKADDKQLENVIQYSLDKTNEPCHLHYWRENNAEYWKEYRLLNNLLWMIPLLADDNFISSPVICQKERTC